MQVNYCSRKTRIFWTRPTPDDKTMTTLGSHDNKHERVCNEVCSLGIQSKPDATSLSERTAKEGRAGRFETAARRDVPRIATWLLPYRLSSSGGGGGAIRSWMERAVI